MAPFDAPRPMLAETDDRRPDADDYAIERDIADHQYAEDECRGVADIYSWDQVFS